MSRESIEFGLKAHSQALFVKAGWIRDPYIILGPDDQYYLTGTTPNPDDPRQQTDPLNIGLGKESIVGEVVQVWRSADLIDWEYLGTPFTLDDRYSQSDNGPEDNRNRIWAPELHWMGDRWALVHCPQGNASFAFAQPGIEIKGPWTHPMQGKFGVRHDPSLFKDDDGTWYVLYGNTLVQPLNEDFSDYTGPATRIDPAGSRIGPDGSSISRIGHEGATIRKIGSKYVHFGTAWSTDRMRKGSYNLYYSTADSINGPYGPRRFVGRFLGHGTPFQTRDGNWWVTAFFNANVPPLDSDGIQNRDLSETAQTINQSGTTIVPLEIQIESDGEVYIRAEDPDYAIPGPDEAQNFQAIIQGS
ncbi:beta-xylosidase [Alteromonas aestuariivivens]|uniref:Beta-xylosidase n=2 Tax=Alteromonas aestuariivivens TaxID=1938339 RepID=A0A3D8MCI4_9ALTE|nr:beta-xylosidase [Alteromonas aestuariivivens]